MCIICLEKSGDILRIIKFKLDFYKTKTLMSLDFYLQIVSIFINTFRLLMNKVVFIFTLYQKVVFSALLKNAMNRDRQCKLGQILLSLFKRFLKRKEKLNYGFRIFIQCIQNIYSLSSCYRRKWQKKLRRHLK